MITTRNATLEDLSAITLLLHDLGYPTNTDDVRSRLVNIFGHDDYKTLLAIDEDGAVLGMIGMTKNYYYEHNGTYIRILVLVVGKPHQNMGVGKLLLNEADQWAIAINAATILLNSGNRPERRHAFAFYQRMGFEIKSSGFVKKVIG